MAIKFNTRDDTLQVPMAIHEIASVAAILAVVFMPFNAQGTFIKFSFSRTMQSVPFIPPPLLC